MNCIHHEGCQCDRFCDYSKACLWKFIQDKSPKSRWTRLKKRLLKFSLTGYCNLSDSCASCQQHKCSVKKFLSELVENIPKAIIYHYNHPRHGVITSYIKPDGKGKENRKKRKTLMRYGCCQNCGATENLTIDHIKEISKGGAKVGLYNMTVLCYDCNQKKSNPNYRKYLTKKTPGINEPGEMEDR